MKKYLVVLFALFLAGCALASDRPMLPVNVTPNSPAKPTHPLNNYNYQGYNININDGTYYESLKYCPYGCFYSTTLTTKELRAYSKAKRRAKLEARCNANKARKSECEKLMEE